MEVKTMEVKTHETKVGNWTTKSTAYSLTLPKQAKEQAMEVINEYLKHFPAETAWVQEKFRVPSLLLSMNCTFRSHLNVYSISQNPKNLGIAVSINPELKAALGRVQFTWPEIKATSHPQFQDDYLWIKTVDLSEVFKQPGNKQDLILIRNPEFNPEYNTLSQRSITSLIKRNSNAYGEVLNLWSRVDFGNKEKLPWQKGFALKPLAKIKSQFNLYRPMPGAGLISEEKIESIISHRTCYVQNFITPMDSPIVGEKMIYKIYFAYDIFTKEYRYLGGLWLSRANYRIHGTPETTFGKLV